MINKAIATGFTYQQREEPGVQTPATTLNNRAGSCRDFATLFIEACRSLGLAARFVSGYLYSPALPQGQAQPRMVGSLPARRRLEGLRLHDRPSGRQ